jgi:hypothetical protein
MMPWKSVPHAGSRYNSGVRTEMPILISVLVGNDPAARFQHVTSAFLRWMHLLMLLPSRSPLQQLLLRVR